MKARTKREVIHIQKCSLAARKCCMLISLAIMYDQFEANEGQMQNAINLYKEETKKCAIWSYAAVKKAYEDFKEVAKTYKGARLFIDKAICGNKLDEYQIIKNSESTCFYTMLKILRQYFKATYEQLDFFIDKYDEFNQIYGEGNQISMQQLSHELYEVTGFDILKIEKGDFI